MQRVLSKHPVVRCLPVLLAGLTGLALSGCDELVGSDFEGEEVFHEQDLAISQTGDYDGSGVRRARYAMFWNPRGLKAPPKPRGKRPE